MNINELYKVFNDIDFQANRLIKSKSISLLFLKQFDELIEQIRPEIIKMDLSQEINKSFDKLGRINLAYNPNLSSSQKFINILFIGFYKKKIKNKKMEHYFREEIQRRKLAFQHIETHLKES